MASRDGRVSAARRAPFVGRVAAWYQALGDAIGAGATHEEVARHVLALADQAPTCLALDDLHWADTSTIQVLASRGGDSRP